MNFFGDKCTSKNTAYLGHRKSQTRLEYIEFLHPRADAYQNPDVKHAYTMLEMR